MRICDDQSLKDSGLLALVCLAIGSYLIGTTVLISQDGVTYIERARQLATDAHTVINLKEPPGFPVLIFAFHWLFDVFFANSLRLWIAAGQISVLLCQTAAVICLYFLARRLFDRQTALWGALILIVLPYPAHYGADVLRDWPHLLFLSAGLLCLHRAIQTEKGVLFFLAGLACGTAMTIRWEGAQIMLYATVFFLIRLAGDIRNKRPLGGACKYAWTAAGFLMVFVVLAWQRDNMIPYKLHMLFEPARVRPAAVSLATFGPAGFGSAAANMVEGLFENMLYYLLIPAGIGLYLFFSKRLPDRHNRILIGMIFGFYVTVLCLLDMRWGYISRRHLLPLTAMLCFFIPAGCRWLGQRLSAKHATTGFYGLMIAGILICLPKLFLPLGADKRPYWQAAQWIAENTPAESVFYTCDNRTCFYAQRDYRLYNRPRVTRKAAGCDYWIVTAQDGKPTLTIGTHLRLEKSFDLDRGKELQIYRRADY